MTRQTAAAATIGWAMVFAVRAGTGQVLGHPPTSPSKRNDIRFSTEVVTPHVPWATRLPGGPIRGFFIPSIGRGRDMVELMQRLSLDPTTVSIDRQWDVNCWGIGDFYGHEERGDRDDFRIVYGYVEQDLTADAPFEVLVIPGLNGWSRMTRPTRDAILRRVRAGAGLVLIHPFVGDVAGHPFAGDEATGDERIWDLSPLVGVLDDRVSERGYPESNPDALAEGRWAVAGDHYITRAIDARLLSVGARSSRFYKYQARGEVLLEADGDPVMAVGRYGAGRVVAFAHAGDGFVPEAVDPVASRTYWDYWEYDQALLARSVLWAARGEPSVLVRSVTASEIEGLEIGLESAAPREIEVEVGVKAEFGLKLGSRSVRQALARGRATIAVGADTLRPAEGWPGGRQIVDVIVRDASSGATLDWGWTSFEVAKPAAVTSIRPNSAVYRHGDTLSIVTRASGRLDGLKLRLTLDDDLDRRLHVEEKPTAGEKYFFYRLDGFLGKRVGITAELVDPQGRIVDHLRHAAVPVVQRERRQGEYRALMSFETPVHNLAALRQRRLRAEAIESGFTWGGDVTDSLDVPRGYFGVYWYDRGPITPEGLDKAIQAFEHTGDTGSLQYLTKKELYRRTGDKRFLVRTPCLDDPAVRDVLTGVARTAARNKAVYGMDYYFVGDEGSLTSYTDPVDFCFCPHTLSKFRRWLQDEYRSLDALNRTWGTAHESWDAVVPATTEEARRSGRFAPWADHRTYMERSFAGAYRAVRDAVVEGDRDGHIALSGTQVTTPYNGCDWHRLDQVIDDFLSYGGGNQWDLHRSFAKPGARVGFWTGYGRSGAAVRHEIWTAALSGVLFPNLFWSYSVVNPDLTFSRSGRDMGTAFRALRFEGIGKLLMEAERVSDGIAIHYSMPAVHAAGILGYHKSRKEDEGSATFPSDRDGWAKSLADLGLSFDFLASPQIEAGKLDSRRHRVLVLPMSLALSAAEVAATLGFARAGGIVIADGAPGLFDEHAAWRDTAALSELFGVSALPSSQRKLKARATGDVSLTDAGRKWGFDTQVLRGLEAFEADLTPKGADALLRIGEAPAAFVRRVGRGWAIYLNVLFDAYPEQRAKAYGGEAHRALLGAVLGHLGVRPPVEVHTPSGHPAGQVSIARYRFGGQDLVALLAEPLDVETRYDPDGVTVYEDAQLGPISRRDVTVRLPRVAEVTNTRTGEDLGRTDSVRLTLAAGDAVVLALAGERGAVTIEGPAEARRGEHVSFRLGVRTAGKHLLRCHVYGPDGRFLPEYAVNVGLEGGTGSFLLPTALSDPPGRYRVKVTDVLTGSLADAGLELK